MLGEGVQLKPHQRGVLSKNWLFYHYWLP